MAGAAEKRWPSSSLPAPKENNPVRPAITLYNGKPPEEQRTPFVRGAPQGRPPRKQLLANNSGRRLFDYVHCNIFFHEPSGAVLELEFDKIRRIGVGPGADRIVKIRAFAEIQGGRRG